jgi:hypothetical protein
MIDIMFARSSDIRTRLDLDKTLESGPFDVFHFRISSAFGVQFNGPAVILRK